MLVSTQPQSAQTPEGLSQLPQPQDCTPCGAAAPPYWAIASRSNRSFRWPLRRASITSAYTLILNVQRRSKRLAASPLREAALYEPDFRAAVKVRPPPQSAVRCGSRIIAGLRSNREKCILPNSHHQ